MPDNEGEKEKKGLFDVGDVDFKVSFGESEESEPEVVEQVPAEQKKPEVKPKPEEKPEEDYQIPVREIEVEEPEEVMYEKPVEPKKPQKPEKPEESEEASKSKETIVIEKDASITVEREDDLNEVLKTLRFGKREGNKIEEPKPSDTGEIVWSRGGEKDEEGKPVGKPFWLKGEGNLLTVEDDDIRRKTIVGLGFDESDSKLFDPKSSGLMDENCFLILENDPNDRRFRFLNHANVLRPPLYNGERNYVTLAFLGEGEEIDFTLPYIEERATELLEIDIRDFLKGRLNPQDKNDDLENKMSKDFEEDELNEILNTIKEDSEELKVEVEKTRLGIVSSRSGALTKYKIRARKELEQKREDGAHNLGMKSAIDDFVQRECKEYVFRRHKVISDDELFDDKKEYCSGGVVVLKIAKKSKRDSSQSEHNKREEALRKLHHKRLMRTLYTTTTVGERRVAIMPFYQKVPNWPLEKILQKVAEPVLEGLEYVHSRVVTHRDIKRDNIMLDENGEGVLGDFGIAMIGKKRSELTRDVPMGTSYYMPPEQARTWENEKIDARSDLFALGKTLYEMITGCTPHDEYTDPVDICAAIINGEKPPRIRQPAFMDRLYGDLERALKENYNWFLRPFVSLIEKRKRGKKIKYVEGELAWLIDLKQGNRPSPANQATKKVREDFGMIIAGKKPIHLDDHLKSLKRDKSQYELRYEGEDISDLGTWKGLIKRGFEIGKDVRSYDFIVGHKQGKRDSKKYIALAALLGGLAALAGRTGCEYIADKSLERMQEVSTSYLQE